MTVLAEQYSWNITLNKGSSTPDMEHYVLCYGAARRRNATQRKVSGVNEGETCGTSCIVHVRQSVCSRLLL